MQEALTNIAKHAEARNALVRLEGKKGKIVAIIKDDGKGFDVDEILGSRHLRGGIGISGMRERVFLLGGSLNIQSRAGHGTRIFIEIPVGIED